MSDNNEKTVREHITVIEEALLLLNDVIQKQASQIKETNIRITLLEKKIKEMEKRKHD